jgi:hypothetical protein
VNGAFDATSACYGAFIDSATTNLSYANNYFGYSISDVANVYLDEMKFWNFALSAAQVLADYRANGSLITYV